MEGFAQRARSLSPAAKRRAKWGGGLCGGAVLITTIVLLTGIKNLSENEQLLVFDPHGRWVAKGPGTAYVLPGKEYTVRERPFLTSNEYLIITDMQTGQLRVQRGPGRSFLGPHEEAGDEHEAASLTEDKYMFVTDKMAGTTVTIRGPRLYFPATAFEEMDVREIIRLAEYETLVTRNIDGALHYHSGAGGGARVILEPHEEVLEFQWTRGGDVEDNHEYVKVTRIDTRLQQLAFWYDDIRTYDNMEFELEGTIFWRVVDPQRLVQGTADPTSDIWHRLRARIAAEATRYSMGEFLANGTEMAKTVMAAEWANNTDFYESRGIWVQSFELIEAELHDEALEKQITDSIAAEATKRLNDAHKVRADAELELVRMVAEHEKEMTRLQQANLQEERRQESALQSERDQAALEAVQEEKRQNASLQAARNRAALEAAQDQTRAEHAQRVEADAAALKLAQEENARALTAAQLANQLARQQSMSALLDTIQTNQRKEAATAGMADGLRRGTAVDEYLQALSASVPELSERLGLYTFGRELESRNATTANLAGGAAQLYVTPEDVHLNLGTLPSRYNRTEL